jgi:hypothetical protein
MMFTAPKPAPVPTPRSPIASSKEKIQTHKYTDTTSPRVLQVNNALLRGYWTHENSFKICIIKLYKSSFKLIFSNSCQYENWYIKNNNIYILCTYAGTFILTKGSYQYQSLTSQNE